MASTYINGLFVTKKEGRFGEEIHIGITDDGLKALAELERTSKGFRNVVLSPQKDPSKYSAKPGFVPQGASVGSDDSSGLPF